MSPSTLEKGGQLFRQVSCDMSLPDLPRSNFYEEKQEDTLGLWLFVAKARHATLNRFKNKSLKQMKLIAAFQFFYLHIRETRKPDKLHIFTSKIYCDKLSGSFFLKGPIV